MTVAVSERRFNHRCRARVTLAWVSTLLAAVVARADGNDAPTRFAVGEEVVVNNMRADDVRVFAIALESGRAYRLEVGQQELDLVVTLRTPDGTVNTYDSPVLRQAPEVLLIEPASAGDAQIRLTSNDVFGRTARSRVRIEPIDTTDTTGSLDALHATTRAAAAFAAGESEGWQQAAAHYRRAIEAARQSGIAALEAQLSFALANLLYLHLTDWNAAVATAQRARDAYVLLNDAAGEAAALHLEGAALSELVNEVPKDAGSDPATGAADTLFDRARARLEQSAAIYARLGDRYQRARVINDLGLSYYYEGSYDEARGYFEQAAALFRADEEWSEELKPLNNLGLIAYEQGRLTDALDSFSRLLRLLPGEGFEWLRGMILDNMGTAYRALGQIDDALASYAQALSFHEARGALKSQGRSLSGIGVTYYTSGQLDLAREYLERALAIRREAHDGRGEAATLRYLGALYLERGDTERAIDAHRRSFELAASPVDRARAQVLLGRDFAAAGRLDDAGETLSEAVESARTARARHVLASAFVERGTVRAHGDRADAARPDLERARELFAAIGLEAGVARAEYELANLAMTIGDVGPAVKHARASIELIEQQRAAILNPDMRAAWLGEKQRHYDLLIEILLSSPSSSAARAIEVDERSRTRAMLDLLAEAAVDVEQDLDPAVRTRREQSLRRLGELRYRQEELLDRGAAPAEIDAVLGELNQVETALDLLEIEQRTSNVRYAALTAPTALDAAGMQGLLDDETVLLQFALGERRSYVFAVTSQRIVAHELDDGSGIDALGREAHERLRTYAPDRRSREALESTLRELSTLLLAPVAGELESHRRIVIVADGALAYVPFAVLPSTKDPAASARLIDTHEIVSIPSMTILAMQRSAPDVRRTGQRTIAIFADPVFAPDDPRFAGTDSAGAHETDAVRAVPIAQVHRLPATSLEAQSIAALVPEQDRLLATGFAATREAALDPALGNYRMIHFATHGLVDARYPALSALVMSLFDPAGQAREGLVRLPDIYRLKLRADLVALSACDTALGREVNGEGLIGLTRGFLHAGARSVVATLWRVPDRATAELMTHLYERLVNAGTSPSAALRAAQLATRAEPRWSDPYYWGAFVVQGDWRTAR